MPRVSLTQLTAALRESWGPDTCAPEDVSSWTEANPSRGQCATTAIVVHDYFGGDLVRGEVHVGGVQVDYHWWNLLPDGTDIDLTRTQFSSDEKVTGRVVIPRPTGATRLDREYAFLANRVATKIS
ncbi:YunG family protein [Rhodococcus sovatensis]|uniref:SnoaL-like domain-containing protein n=1 Tax=Rhodococcus sovatensis TaxID=1805840 RepID=A0ABZ2PH70_9NOCA